MVFLQMIWNVCVTSLGSCSGFRQSEYHSVPYYACTSIDLAVKPSSVGDQARLSPKQFPPDLLTRQVLPYSGTR
jgi:hypothetical protein